MFGLTIRASDDACTRGSISTRHFVPGIFPIHWPKTLSRTTVDTHVRFNFLHTEPLYYSVYCVALFKGIDFSG